MDTKISTPVRILKPELTVGLHGPAQPMTTAASMKKAPNEQMKRWLEPLRNESRDTLLLSSWARRNSMLAPETFGSEHNNNQNTYGYHKNNGGNATNCHDSDTHERTSHIFIAVEDTFIKQVVKV